MESYASGAQTVAAQGQPLLLRSPVKWLVGAYRLASPTNVQTPRFAPAQWPGSRSADDLEKSIRQHADQITLDYLPADSAPVIWAQALDGHRDVDLSARAMVPVTECTAPFDAFIQRRSKRERQRIRRLVADFEVVDSGYEFAVHERPSAVQRMLTDCLQLEQAGWKGAEKTAILDDPAHAQFYRMLAVRGASQGAIRLATLHRHGKLVAFEYCLLWDDRLLALKTSYDEAFAASSPGHMLAVLHIRRCCEDPLIALYDATGNGMTPSAHVMRYADRVEALFTLTVFAGTMRGKILRNAKEMRRFLRIVKRRWLKSNR